MARQVLENGVILPAEYSDDWYDDMTSNLTKLDDVIGSDSEKLSSADVGAAALSNNYNDLDNLPTIPTVNDATLTIQKNGVDVQTFTANASSNVTANITVPTKTSDLTNDSNFVDTSNSAVASGITSAKVTDYDTHIADTDIHVTTADKTKWNNGVSQSYVLRYSSASVTDNSTIAYSTLDNTDNIKASDKVIDVDGKIFSIVSVDTTNQTVTVGSALIDLAIDSNVMHLSGNETIAGDKNFKGLIKTASNPTLWPINTQTTDDITFLHDSAVHVEQRGSGNLTDLSNGAWNIANLGIGCFFFRNNNGTDIRYKNFAQNTVNRIYIVSNTNRQLNSLTPETDNTYNLGDSTRRWKQINGINPGALSLPDLDNGIDISSYITIGDTDNNYTPPANGWIWIRLVGNGASIIQGNFGINSSYVTNTSVGEKWVETNLFVTKDIQATIRCRGITGIVGAKFYPCQGNV